MDEIEELREPLDTSTKLSKHQREAGRVGGLSRSEAKRAAVRANLAKARQTRWKGREEAARFAARVSSGIVEINKIVEATNGHMRGLTTEDIQAHANTALDKSLEIIAREEGALTNGLVQEALHPRTGSRDGSLRPPGEEEVPG